MASFEEIGRSVDEELARLKRFFRDEVRPKTRRRLAKALRKASARLSTLAEELEQQPGDTERSAPASEEPTS
jgi:hypothetical protein